MPSNSTDNPESEHLRQQKREATFAGPTGSVRTLNNMKCTCKECNGNGEIPCPECDGQGTYEVSIETITLEKTVKNYDELSEIQKDAKRVIRQAAKLKELNPARGDSYDAQLKATLFVINGQAEAAAKREALNGELTDAAPNVGTGDMNISLATNYQR
jgi:hypothetical protein